MVEPRPSKDFGKRKPVATPSAAPVKRSGHVGLLLMGTLAVGGGAYALMPRENCQAIPPGMAAPTTPQASAGCVSRGASGGSGGGYSRSSPLSFYGGDSSSSRASASSDSSSGSVTRGGFGSFARAFGLSGRG
ncbi:MAG: hypothetical protein E6G85_05145 [Alphaproteobacteria bacterium]|nr:MAG: hypothetical protein E6G85_05145 [Alphaproteobacteria bacterium]